ncbi:GPI inositol-deacylase [Macrobrachium rosenbergii]|uniref:GPI inositol-deacylase n=1 Tax=Macrobrachium rosenbergii TaxID=79674 RepID=UPI0034D44F3A
MASKLKLLLAGVLCALLMAGAYDHIFNIETNKCLMTYMFEYPQFIPVSFPARIKKLFPHYHLYSYGEGNYSDILREGYYAGIPVLFIPGNGGSYRQVRSLASVAYRKALDDETDFAFNFFTVDLNEELGAFYGPALKRQTEFVTYAIRQILKLYDDRVRKPKSIVLVGHSMGGMVARALLASENVTASTVPLIITQATPHTRPVVTVDHHLKEFYEKVNDYWEKERNCTLKDVILITVGGGRNDIQVATSHINTPFADIATTTSNVPHCWLTADHQAIVWCKQLVMAIVRSLFDIVDSSTKQITTSRKLIVDTFEFHLAKRITGKRFKRATYSEEVAFDENADWIVLETRQETYVANKTGKNTFLVIPLNPTHRLYQKATIVASNLNRKDWIMACKTEMRKNKRICVKGENLSQKTKKLYGKVKTVQLELPALSKNGYTAIAVYIGPTDERVEVAIDVHSENGRHRSVEVPVFIRSFTQTLIVDTTPQKALSYNVSLLGLQEPWQSFRFMLRPRQRCEGQTVTTAMIYMPWAQKESYLQRSGQVVSFSAELDLPPPPGDNSSASIQFFLNPQCTYSVIIQGSLIGVFRRLVWLYGAQIPSYCAVHLLLALANQLKVIGEEGYCPSFFSAVIALSPVTVVPFTKVINLILYNLDILDDFTVMSNNGESLGILPILMFLGILPITLIIGLVTWGMVILSGNAAHSFIVKVLGRSIGGGELVGDVVIAGLSRVPLFVSVALISLSYSSCGTLALCLSAGFYFIKIFRLYEDYIQTFLTQLIPGMRKEADDRKALSSIHFHITLLLLVTLVAAFNIPALIIWGRSLGHNLQLPEDPSLFVTVSLLSVLCFLWQWEIPRVDKNYYKYVSHAVRGIAVFTLLFGSIHIYRVPYFLVSALTLMTIHQFLAPTKPLVTQVSDEVSSNDITRDNYVDEIEAEYLAS